jgi:succinyl-CoA synthetase beta subunit
MKCDVIASGIVNAAKQVRWRSPHRSHRAGSNGDENEGEVGESGAQRCQ